MLDNFYSLCKVRNLPIMDTYSYRAFREMQLWQKDMQRKPGFLNSLAKKLQTRINRIIPEKVHAAITTAIKQMVRAVLLGAGISSSKPLQVTSLEAFPMP